jgi:hypothetical protein
MPERREKALRKAQRIPGSTTAYFFWTHFPSMRRPGILRFPRAGLPGGARGFLLRFRLAACAVG